MSHRSSKSSARHACERRGESDMSTYDRGIGDCQGPSSLRRSPGWIHTMSIRDRLRTVFAFNTIPTTILLVLVYVAVFTTVLVTDNLPAVPKDTRGLDLDQAWWDLHQVGPLTIPCRRALSPFPGVCQTTSLQLACQRPRP